MTLEIVSSEEAPTSASCDVLLTSATRTAEGFELSGWAGEIDTVLDGLISEHLMDAGFAAEEAEMELVSTARRVPFPAVAVMGLGTGPAPPKPDVLRRVAGSAARRLSGRPVVASALAEGVEPEAVAEGFLLGSYRFTEHKSQPRPAKLQTVKLIGGSDPEGLHRARARADATNLARDLVNEPPMCLTPDLLARRAREIADVAGLECKVLDEEELSERGLGGLLGVARGSSNPPRLIELRHAPPDARKRIVLVGKGVTFDSGGLSIKDAKSMETMKTDMAGAAAVLATLSAAPRLGVAHEIVGLVPSCENMPGGRALRPGDVLTHYGGRTTEVNNTDAEGRLILADALKLAGEHEPTAIVDVATLTGGIVVALGRKATGMFSTDEDLAGELLDAAERAGERMWRLPLYDDYRAELDSDVADMKNSGGRFGSSIIAALFLREFVSADVPWAHLDIAGSARAEVDAGEVVKGGTGAGTRTLLSWLEDGHS
jgi:leucyl aminopeptidase